MCFRRLITSCMPDLNATRETFEEVGSLAGPVKRYTVASGVGGSDEV